MGKKRMSLSRLQALSSQTTIDTTLYEGSLDGSVQQSQNFTISTNTNIFGAAPSTSGLTGSLAVASMVNGQQITIFNPTANSFLLSATSGKLLVGGVTASSTVFPAGKTVVYLKADRVGADANILLHLMSGSIG